MAKASIHRLVQIYLDNQQLEGSAEISGHKATLLIKRCQQALNLIEKQFPDEAGVIENLKKHIEKMEDRLAKYGYVNSIDYNLDARIQIHMVIAEYNLFGKESGWLTFFKGDKLLEHWVEFLEPVCKSKYDSKSESEPTWHRSKRYSCSKCTKYVLNLIQKEHDRETNPIDYSGSAYGIHFDFDHGKVKILK